VRLLVDYRILSVKHADLCFNSSADLVCLF